MNYILTFLIGILLFTGKNCRRNEPVQAPTTIYKAEIYSRAQLESSLKAENAKDVVNPGKIYTKGNFIYLGEQYEGVHIINNADIRNPVKVGFLKIKGCIDIAIKGNYLYADNAVDLITIDISDPNPLNISVVHRNKNVFPMPVPPDLGYMPSEYANMSKDSIIVAWKK